MYEFDDVYDEQMIDPDSAIMSALAATEKGLFDVDDTRDEDLQALYDH